MLDILKTALISITAFISTFLPQPTYVEGVVGQPVEFNPLVKSQNEIDEAIESLVFANLVDDLAEAIDISEDGKEYIFHLKSDLTFHNGQRITAQDVRYTINQIKELQSLTLNVVDATTIRIELEKPFAPLLENLTVGIIPEGTSEEYLKLQPNGSGDYKVTEIKRGALVEEITLENFRGDYSIKKLVFRFFPTHKELEAAVKLGDINAYAGPQITDWPNLHYYQAPLKGSYYGLFFNLGGQEILRDREFRKNLSRALNKQVIIEQALNNQAVAIDGPLANSWAESEDISVYEYNSDLDVKYNANLKLTVPATTAHLKTADIIKEMWSKLGVAVEIEPVPPQEIIDKVIKPKNFDILLYGQKTTADPDRYVYWHSTQENYPGLNFTSYEQMRVNKSLEEGRKTANREERKTHYANFQRILTADAPAIYLYQPVYTFAVSKKISGIDLEGLFAPHNRFLSLPNWKLK